MKQVALSSETIPLTYINFKNIDNCLPYNTKDSILSIYSYDARNSYPIALSSTALFSNRSKNILASVLLFKQIELSRSMLRISHMLMFKYFKPHRKFFITVMLQATLSAYVALLVEVDFYIICGFDSGSCFEPRNGQQFFCSRSPPATIFLGSCDPK